MSKLEKEWKKRTKNGEAKAVQNFQKIGTDMLDPSWDRTRMEYVPYHDMDEEGNERELRMVDGNTLEGKGTKCYKKNEAANMSWDAVEEANFPQCNSVEILSLKGQ